MLMNMIFMKFGLILAVFLLVSGCSTFIAESPEEIQAYNLAQSKNAELKVEKRALMEAVQEKKQELDSMDSASQQRF